MPDEEQTIQAEPDANVPVPGRARSASQRARRLFAEVAAEQLRARSSTTPSSELGFAILCTITGLDEGETLGVIYHLARDDGIVLNLQIGVPKDEPGAPDGHATYFPGGRRSTSASWSTCWASRSRACRRATATRCPTTGPTGQYPLRKDWKPAMLPTTPPQKEAECMNGKTSQIPIGPQHPALKEPESFTLTLDGEKIVEMGVRLGYNHRGIEKACEERTYIQDIYLIERICGICSHSHSTCFVQAVEEIAGLEVPAARRSTSARSSPSWSASTATCCGWAWPATRSASTRCSCTPGATARW